MPNPKRFLIKLLLIVLVVPLLASAQTASALTLEQLDQLFVRVHQLQAQVAALIVLLQQQAAVGNSGVADGTTLPTLLSVAKLFPNDGQVANEAGFSLAVFGGVAVVGAHLADPRGNDSGAAYVFRNNGTAWVQEQKLVPTDGQAGDHFGTSVAAGPNLILVAAAFDDDRGADSGSFYSFRYNGTTWVQEQKITASDGLTGDLFGNTISLSGDKAIVGAYGRSEGANYAGAAYTFNFNGTTWVQSQKLLPVNATAAEGFGKSVSINGNFAVVGSFQDDTMATNAGAAYVYNYNGSNWSQQIKLTANDGGQYQIFGSAVAMGDDMVLVGAPKDNDKGNMSGSAYIFRNTDGAWIQEAKLVDPAGWAGDLFGNSVAFSGSKALVGSPFWEDRTVEFPSQDQGAVSVYESITTGNWTPTKRLLAADGYYFDSLASSVSGAGNFVLAGASKEDAVAMDSGSIYVFNLAPIVSPPGGPGGSQPCSINNNGIKNNNGLPQTSALLGPCTQ